MSQESLKLSEMQRRGSLRLRLEERVQIGQSGKQYCDAVSYDISESGISVKSHDFIPEKTVVNIILNHSNKPLNLEGIVAWVSGKNSSDQYKMGIKITNPCGELTNIYEYLLRIT
ncbi:MAG: PilZ domain-containing protein [Candidatus Dadabacteria bacterium]|nr:PilZ domain-containing protein [Candidatus Dadabacteria bacterium]NIS07647.1 PilZ domain-containing protein [Candidatus Dadabacteria bacterium]NIV42118.1 hypothetical protein [Candidatus Dadabacteria bacterium]NIX14742.1 hypothetical protein [Candidatus Dadabacteria bacterium]NIY21285.1 hypothetical protein [Candidatus Dadabacteria bacterium]